MFVVSNQVASHLILHQQKIGCCVCQLLVAVSRSTPTLKASRWLCTESLTVNDSVPISRAWAVFIFKLSYHTYMHTFATFPEIPSMCGAINVLYKSLSYDAWPSQLTSNMHPHRGMAQKDHKARQFRRSPSLGRSGLLLQAAGWEPVLTLLSPCRHCKASRDWHCSHHFHSCGIESGWSSWRGPECTPKDSLQL